jgi:hypothetical protein
MASSGVRGQGVCGAINRARPVTFVRWYRAGRERGRNTRSLAALGPWRNPIRAGLKWPFPSISTFRSSSAPARGAKVPALSAQSRLKPAGLATSGV